MSIDVCPYPDLHVKSGDYCSDCGLLKCVYPNDHSEDYGYCAICGWDIRSKYEKEIDSERLKLENRYSKLPLWLSNMLIPRRYFRL